MTLIRKYSHKERRSAWKMQAVIVFLKLNFDLPHIFIEIWSWISCKSRPQMMFSWNATKISHMLYATQTKERSKNEKEYEIIP